MKVRIATLSVALAIASMMFTTAYAQGSTWIGSNISLSAAEIKAGITKVIATGNAHVKGFDKLTNREFEAYSNSIVVTLFNSPDKKGGQTGLDSVKSVDFAGPVKIIYVTKEQGTPVKTVATADDAKYNGMDKIAYLTGNVKITNENPSLFDAPAVMTGDKATINLNRNLGPDDFRFRVESTNGVSRIEATPKPKEQGKK